VNKVGIAAVALSLAVCCAPLAMAAPGESSGPAAGTPTPPGAAGEKQGSTGPASADPQASSRSTAGVSENGTGHPGTAPNTSTGPAGQPTPR